MCVRPFSEAVESNPCGFMNIKELWSSNFLSCVGRNNGTLNSNLVLAGVCSWWKMHQLLDLCCAGILPGPAKAYTIFFPCSD